MPPMVASQTALTSYFGEGLSDVGYWVLAEAESIANTQQQTPNKKRLKVILEEDSGLNLPGLHLGLVRRFIIALVRQTAPSNVARIAHFNIVGKAHLQHL